MEIKKYVSFVSAIVTSLVIAIAPVATLTANASDDGLGYYEPFNPVSLGSYDVGYSSPGPTSLGSYDVGYYEPTQTTLGSYDVGYYEPTSNNLGSYDVGYQQPSWYEPTVSSYYEPASYSYYEPGSYNYYEPGSIDYYQPSSYDYYQPSGYSYYDYGYQPSSYNYGYSSTPVYTYDYSYDYSYDYVRETNHNQNVKPVCAISASDTSIDEDESTTLHWTSEHATSATLSGFGSVSTGGSRTVSPNDDTTYTLTVRGNGGTETCSTTVHVQEKHHNSNLSCDLNASDTRVEEGDRVTLEWDTTGNVTRASINNGVGTVDEDGGSERVTVDEDTTYKMTVRNDEGDEDTCSVTVRVDDNNFSSVTFTGESVNNPPVVYLSDIPYTGLEDITPALLSYYLALIALAGAGVWFLYRKGMIPHFAFASADPIDEGHVEEVEEGHVENPAVESFLASLANDDTDAALDHLRDAAATGTGIEEFLAEAEGATTDTTLQARISAALEGAKHNGIRGVKQVLTA